MARQVSWRWVPGAVCPHCKGAVQYNTTTKPDYHNPTGFAEVKEPVTVKLDRPKCAADEPVDEIVGVRGHQEIVKKKWLHKLDVICPQCNLMLSSWDLLAGEPEEYPLGYWVEVE